MTTTMTKKKIQQSTTQEIRDESGSGCSGNMPQKQWRWMIRGGLVGCGRQEARVEADERGWRGWERQAAGGFNL